MSRRRFLKLASASLVAACGAPSGIGRTARSRGAIKAIAFDLFTLFDPRTVARVAESVLPGRSQELCDAWRLRQFEYSWIRTAAGQYLDFHAVTDEALTYAARAQNVSITPDARASLLGAYERLEPWPDTIGMLRAFKQAGLVLAPLANYTPSMIENLLVNGGVREYFDELLSADRVKAFKPDPKAYAMGPSVLGFGRDQIAFAAFGGWDAAGARWFGYPTFWVNRLGQPREELGPGPDATGSTLAELGSWLSTI